MVEPIAKFTAALEGLPGVGRIYNIGLEEWRPDDSDSDAAAGYDLIWNQWCLGHLTDDQLQAYLQRCGTALSRAEDGTVKGVIVVKENMSTAGEDRFDPLDSSITRYVTECPLSDNPFIKRRS